MEGNLIVVLGGVVRLYGVDSVVNSRVNADNFVVLAIVEQNLDLLQSSPATTKKH